jgi:hypothetical protein
MAAEPAVPAAPSSPSDAAAAAYQQALAQHERGELKAALMSMQESYRLSGRAELIYNIARLEAELGDCAASLIHYQEYIEKVPGGRYRAAAERARDELAQRCPEPAPAPEAPQPEYSAKETTTAPAPVLPVAVPVERQPHREAARHWVVPRWAGWSALAAGALASTGAVYFTLAAVDAHDRLQAGVENQLKGGARADLTLQDEQDRNERWAQAFAITSGALLVGGALLLILTPGESTTTTTTANVYVQPGLIGAQLSQRF